MSNFVVLDSKFDRYLDLNKRVSNDVINEQYIKYFDNDGFELSYLEQEYYRENGVPLYNCLNHSCNQHEWITIDDPNFKLDHCIMLQRFQFVGEAKEQLESHKTRFPQLNKYTKLKPKWGLDFSLEYYDDFWSIEVVHFEIDDHNYYEALARKEYLENKILNTDWIDFVNSLKRHRSEWEHLTAMDQNDWKAKHWGLNRAEHTYKAFAA